MSTARYSPFNVNLRALEAFFLFWFTLCNAATVFLPGLSSNFIYPVCTFIKWGRCRRGVRAPSDVYGLSDRSISSYGAHNFHSQRLNFSNLIWRHDFCSPIGIFSNWSRSSDDAFISSWPFLAPGLGGCGFIMIAFRTWLESTPYRTRGVHFFPIKKIAALLR